MADPIETRFLRGAAPDTEARLLALVFVSFSFSLFLQSARMLERSSDLFSLGDKLGVLGALGFVGSSLLFQLALALFCTGTLLLVRHRRTRRLWTLFLQLLIILVMIVEAVCHVYFIKTGATLDWPLFAYSLSRPYDVLLIGDNAIDPWIWRLLLFYVALVAVVPWLAGWRARRRKANPPAIEKARRLALMLALSSVPVCGSALLPSTALAVDAATPRDPVINLMATGFAKFKTWFNIQGVPVQEFDLEIAPVGPRQTRPPNVVIVLLESTRATATSLFPPYFDTTPFLAELAPRSLVATRFHAPMPQTKKALRHVLCGRNASHSVRPQAFLLGLNGRCLPNLLREQGYRTVFLQSAEERFDQRPSVVFSMGYQKFIGPNSYSHDGFERANTFGFDDESMLAPSEQWLRKNADRPFFATYLTVNGHFFCQPLTRHGIRHFVKEKDFDCYLNNVSHDDFFLRGLVDQYRALGLLDNTIFIITADHGEAFGDHWRRGHGDTPWEDALHTPFLIYDESGRYVRPGLLEALASELDILPTVLELLGFQVTKGQVDGQTLFHLPEDRTLFMSCSEEDNCLASLRGDRKFIYYFWRHQPQLFDLRHDPREQHDLSAGFPDEVKARQAELLDWERRVRETYEYFETHRHTPPVDQEDLPDSPEQVR